MAIENPTQIKIVLPDHLFQRLERDASAASVPVASIVRVILAKHYELMVGQQPGEMPREVTIGGVTYTKIEMREAA